MPERGVALAAAADGAASTNIRASNTMPAVALENDDLSDMNRSLLELKYKIDLFYALRAVLPPAVNKM